MTRHLDRIKDLQRLTALALHATRSEMASLQAREADLREKLVTLAAQKHHASRAADDPAVIAGADLRWQQWVDQRRAAINAELAQVLALSDNCRSRLRATFGRDQAASALGDQARAAERLRAARVANYES